MDDLEVRSLSVYREDREDTPFDAVELPSHWSKKAALCSTMNLKKMPDSVCYHVKSFDRDQEPLSQPIYMQIKGKSHSLEAFKLPVNVLLAHSQTGECALQPSFIEAK